MPSPEGAPSTTTDPGRKSSVCPAQSAGWSQQRTLGEANGKAAELGGRGGEGQFCLAKPGPSGCSRVDTASLQGPAAPARMTQGSWPRRTEHALSSAEEGSVHVGTHLHVTPRSPSHQRTAAGKAPGCRGTGHRRTHRWQIRGVPARPTASGHPEVRYPPSILGILRPPSPPPAGSRLLSPPLLASSMCESAPPPGAPSAPGDSESSHHLLPARTVKPACWQP